MNPAAAIDIDAPLDVVWAVMTDTAGYGEWNPFVERVETAQPPQVGNPIILHVMWSNGSRNRSPERITALDGPTTDPATGTTSAVMSYVYEGLPSKLGLVRSVRHQQLTQRPGGPTTYETVGEFSGPFVRFAGPARVADGFRRHAEGLKARAENLAG